MTRFARYGTKKVHEATPWQELAQGVKAETKKLSKNNADVPESEETTIVENVEEIGSEEIVVEGKEKGNEEDETTEGKVEGGDGTGKKKKKKQNKKKKGANLEGGEGETDAATAKALQKKEAEKNKLEKRKERRRKRRLKNVPCLACRQLGHTMNECPKATEANQFVCYRCGSKDHKTAACRKKAPIGGPEFPFAKCFICNEMGHLTRSCPDNPRGLYPRGGGCKVCGSVEHLMTDCPQNQREKEEKYIRLGVQTSTANVEDDLMGSELDSLKEKKTNTRPTPYDRPSTWSTVSGAVGLFGDAAVTPRVPVKAAPKKPAKVVKF